MSRPSTEFANKSRFKLILVGIVTLLSYVKLKLEEHVYKLVFPFLKIHLKMKNVARSVDG